MYDGVAVGRILAEKHDSTIIPGDIILEIQYIGVVTCDTILENNKNVFLSIDSKF